MRPALVVLLLPAVALALLAAGGGAAAARADGPAPETFVVVAGSSAHLQPAPDAIADADKFALPALSVSVEAAAGLPAVIARLAPPHSLSQADSERLAQLAAAPPSADASASASSSD